MQPFKYLEQRLDEAERRLPKMIDLEANDEQLFELYLINCERDHLTPSLKDYLIWLEENYA